AADGEGGAALSRLGYGLGLARRGLEAATAVALARHARLHPAGHAAFDGTAWGGLPERLAVAVLGRLCACVAGRAAPPRDTAIRAATDALRQPGGTASATAAGCRLLRRPSVLLVCRETRHLPDPLFLRPGLRAVWDGRFQVA